MVENGTSVEWAWGNGTHQEKVIETHSESVTNTLKGNEETRYGEPANKAFLIEQEDGIRVLKLENEVIGIS